LLSPALLKAQESRWTYSRKKQCRDVSGQTGRAWPGLRFHHSLIDLESEARGFAAEVTNLLNRTVTDGMRLTVVIAHRSATTVHVGRGIGRQDLSVKLLPLTLGKKPLVAYLLAAYVLEADPEKAYLAVAKSQYGLYLDGDLRQMLVHWDYEREPANAYAAAHMQVNGECEHFNALTEQARNSGRVCPQRPLRDFHFPVGGRRFRPSLEDVIEFLAVEGLAEVRPGWEEAVREHRERWEERQLQAAVRRHPHVAMEQLRKDHQI